jgi:hypothetical protein
MSAFMSLQLTHMKGGDSDGEEEKGSQETG